MSEFGDSADWRNIPEGWAAMLPADGAYAAPASAALRFPRARWYTVTGDGTRAGAIDWEPGNPCFTAAGLRGFVRQRRAMAARARVYVPRSLAAEAIAALRDSGRGELLAYERLLWWIPTLDGTRWTAAELAADLAASWDAPIPEAQLWANQYATLTAAGPLYGLSRARRDAAAAQAGAYDVSTLFGEW